MRFEILGPLRVTVHGREIPISAGRDRAVLAMLVLHANRIVAVSDLIDSAWADNVPRDARSQLHGCISRLRKRLASNAADQIIITEPDGYRLRADSKSVDLLMYRALVAQARTAAAGGDHDEACERYRAALGLWRGGAVLAGMDRGAIRQIAAGIDEERTRTIEDRIDLELARGAADELIGELTELAYLHPYRERLHGALMLALYRADRQADALAAYQRIRDTLVSELGQEPGPGLRDLHRRILAGDEALHPSSSRRWTERPAAPMGNYLPRTVSDFTGREADLAWLMEASEEPDSRAPTVLAIDGMPGVGKTSLAVHAAHLLAPRFPGGRLFIDLHGHSKHSPTDPHAALGALLRQLGVSQARIATDPDQRVAQWRAELAGRRVLIVLDNAATSAQLLPLLPAQTGSLALITSRRRLTDLDNARPRSIDTLQTGDAVTLLRQMVGPRVDQDPDAAADVVARCDHLPLALRIAGARLAHRPNWRVRDLADRLASPHSVLAEMSAGDRTVIDAFALSYEHLSTVARRMFRLLSVDPGEHFDIYTAAALADVSVSAAQRVIDELVDTHLVQEPSANRFRLHDLMKAYAAGLAARGERDADRHAAVVRLLDHLVHATTAASDHLESPASRRTIKLQKPLRPDLVKPHGRWRVDWLEVSRPNLTAAVDLAASLGLHQYCWQLARALWPYLFGYDYLDDIVRTQRNGLVAAERLGDADATATMSNYLASAYFRTGRYGDAIDELERALDQRRRAGDRVSESLVRKNITVVYAHWGRSNDALRQCEHALATARTASDPYALATVVASAGHVYLRLERPHDALRYSRRALTLARAAQAEDLVAIALGNIGAARTRLGHHRAAIRLLAASLAGKRRTKNRFGQSETLNELGVAHRALGDYDSAIAHHRHALAIMREAGFHLDRAMVYNDFGFTLRLAGDEVSAIEMHQRALAHATRSGHEPGQAKALDGIAACLRNRDPESARRHWLRALRLYQQLDLPDRHDVERQLAALDGSASPAAR